MECWSHQAVHKNNSVSGRPAGGLKKVQLETFFPFFPFLFFSSPKMDNIFHGKKKKWKKIAAARLAAILATRCTGNRFFFMDSLRKVAQSQKWSARFWTCSLQGPHCTGKIRRKSPNLFLSGKMQGNFHD